MPTITIFFPEVRTHMDYTLIGKNPDGSRLLIDKKNLTGDKIVVGVPLGAWVRYIEYVSKQVTFKTQWIRKNVTEDLSYGAKPEKPLAPALPIPSPTLAPKPPTVIEEETPEFWQGKGFAPSHAFLIAAWCKENQATPSFEKIQKIIGKVLADAPEVAPKPKTLRQQWDDFFKNPDVITAIGLTPSSVQESFSLVFSHYSIINDKEQTPEPGDYISVGLIIAGVTLAAATILWAVMPGAGAAADLSYIEPGLTAGRVLGTGIKGFLGTLKGATLRNPLLALLLISQADVVFWAPSVLRAPIQTSVSQATGYKITLENAIKNRNWSVATVALANLRAEYDNMEEQLNSLPAKFFGAVGVPFSDFRVALQSGRDAIAAYEKAYPRLATLPVTYPKEFIGDDVNVIDGDSIQISGYPEIRILGIDTHEAETDAGKEETAYLKTLIQGRQVKILTHQYGDPDMTIDPYGRLLAGVFLEDTDIARAMLEHFGKSILTAKTYRKKYRWIDWDEYARVADAAKGPAVREFKIYIDSTPSNAKLYIDGKYTRHLTPSDEKELKDVMDMLAPGKHIIMATKAGLEGSAEVNVVEGVNPDVLLALQVRGLKPTEPEEVPSPPEAPEAPPEEKFVLKILSTPSRAKLYVDGTYTHHLTPSDEKELEDVITLLSPGSHVIRATKGGKSVEKVVEIVAGANEPIYLTLDVVGLPRSAEDLAAEIQGYKTLVANLEAELARL